MSGRRATKKWNNAVETPLKDLWPCTRRQRWMDKENEPGLVSVIVPTYNRAELLPLTLDSVWKQSYRPIELIIVDDGSTDRTPRLLHEWKEKRDEAAFRVHILRQDNSGAPAARNQGLIASQGEFIQYLDSDDLLHPKKLEVHVTALVRHPEASHVWSERRMFNEEPSFDSCDVEVAVRSAHPLGDPAFGDVPCNVWSALFTRDLCRKVGPWNEDIEIWQDVEYNTRVFISGLFSLYVDRFLYLMRNHDGERVHSHDDVETYIRKGIFSLDRCEANIIRADGAWQSVKEAISGFYFQLFRQALHTGNDQLVAKTAAKSCNLTHDTVFKVKIGALRLLRTFAGTTAAKWTLDAYTQLTFEEADVEKQPTNLRTLGE